jgi:hypothetical protein
MHKGSKKHLAVAESIKHHMGVTHEEAMDMAHAAYKHHKSKGKTEHKSVEKKEHEAGKYSKHRGYKAGKHEGHTGRKFR